MTLDEMAELCGRITFPKMLIVVRTKNDVPYLQITARGQCNTTGEDVDWNGRKWMLSEHMTPGEIVQTAFKAIMTAVEHETREQFRYFGQPIFDPHYDIDALVALRMNPASIKERAPHVILAEDHVEGR